MKPFTRETILSGYKSSRLYELIGEIKNSVSDDDKVNFVTYLLHPMYKRRFVIGSGRTLNAMKSFAMRMMHLDLGEVYVIGETTTPAIEGKYDLIIASSGSGSTEEVTRPVEVAKELGASIIGITTDKDSPLAKKSDCLLYVPVNETLRNKLAIETSSTQSGHGYIESQIRGQFERSKLLGTLFEDTIAITLDETIEICMDILGKTEEDLRSKHENLNSAAYSRKH